MKKIISFKTKYGWINVKEENHYITSISFGKEKNKGLSKNLIKIKKEIKNYFLGKKIILKCNFKTTGTLIQKKIWKELQNIPYGQTKSYSEIAKKIKTSPRVVGNVCGKNRHLLVIPCHRVIRNDGSLGGFSGTGGKKLKQRLLNLES